MTFRAKVLSRSVWVVSLTRSMHSVQIGPDNPAEYMKGELWVKCLKQEAFHKLRTQQQLGYIVALTSWSNLTISSIAFILQSSSYPAHILEDRCEQFLEYATEKLDSMSEEEFQQHVGLFLPYSRNAWPPNLHQAAYGVWPCAWSSGAIYFASTVKTSPHLHRRPWADSFIKVNEHTWVDILPSLWKRPHQSLCLTVSLPELEMSKKLIDCSHRSLLPMLLLSIGGAPWSQSLCGAGRRADESEEGEEQEIEATGCKRVAGDRWRDISLWSQGTRDCSLTGLHQAACSLLCAGWPPLMLYNPSDLLWSPLDFSVYGAASWSIAHIYLKTTASKLLETIPSHQAYLTAQKNDDSSGWIANWLL